MFGAAVCEDGGTCFCSGECAWPHAIPELYYISHGELLAVGTIVYHGKCITTFCGRSFSCVINTADRITIQAAGGNFVANCNTVSSNFCIFAPSF